MAITYRQLIEKNLVFDASGVDNSDELLWEEKNGVYYPITHTPGEWCSKDGQIYSLTTGNTIAILPYYDKTDGRKVADANRIVECVNNYDKVIKERDELKDCLRCTNALMGQYDDLVKSNTLAEDDDYKEWADCIDKSEELLNL